MASQTAEGLELLFSRERVTGNCKSDRCSGRFFVVLSVETSSNEDMTACLDKHVGDEFGYGS
jgi:hypothetical protein